MNPTKVVRKSYGPFVICSLDVVIVQLEHVDVAAHALVRDALNP